MFSKTVQPSVVSLFSSTGSLPLQLFRTNVDLSLPSDSCIQLLHDKDSLPRPAFPAILIPPPPLAEHYEADSEDSGYSLNQTVLHIQSPTLRTTYIQSPANLLPIWRTQSSARDASNDLAIKHPWMHIQVRNIGREWSFEVGLVDQSGRMGIMRLSTFQKQPRLKLSTVPNSYPLLHLPLAFPPSSSRPLTAWSTVTLCLPSYLPHFSSSRLMAQGDNPVGNDHIVRSERTSTMATGTIPNGTYSHVAYVRVYATCRLRRIWFSEGGPGQKMPWEFELYGDE